MKRVAFALVAMAIPMAAHAQDTVGVTPPTGSAQTVTCRTYAVTGSNAETSRLCLTGAQWDARSRRSLYSPWITTVPNTGFYAGSSSISGEAATGR